MHLVANDDTVPLQVETAAELAAETAAETAAAGIPTGCDPRMAVNALIT